MKNNHELQTGLVGKAELIVTESHTARSMGSGRMPILATPAMVALMEAAAQNAVDNLLPANQQTIGTHLDIQHYGATPIGMQVKAKAELKDINGRNLSFRITVRDEHEMVGEGQHQRAITNTASFERLLRRKK